MKSERTQPEDMLKIVKMFYLSEIWQLITKI